jgi:hypothetical protein
MDSPWFGSTLEQSVDPTLGALWPEYISLETGAPPIRSRASRFSTHPITTAIGGAYFSCVPSVLQSKYSTTNLAKPSKHVGNEAIRHELLVGVPIFPVPDSETVSILGGRDLLKILLFLTHLVVSMLPVNQQHREIGYIEISNGGVECGGQRPGQRHQEVSTWRHKYCIIFKNE